MAKIRPTRIVRTSKRNLLGCQPFRITSRKFLSFSFLFLIDTQRQMDKKSLRERNLSLRIFQSSSSPWCTETEGRSRDRPSDFRSFITGPDHGRAKLDISRQPRQKRLHAALRSRHGPFPTSFPSHACSGHRERSVPGFESPPRRGLDRIPRSRRSRSFDGQRLADFMV